MIFQNSETITYNDNTIVSGVAFCGRSERPNGTPYASLAHELAHSTDRIAETIKDDKETDLWLTDTGVTQCEIYATFIENQILKEHEQPLRSAYVYDKNGNPIDGRIIDNKERSLYLNKSGQHKDNFGIINNSERFIF